MNYKEITKQVIDTQKMMFNNWYSAASMIQDQTTLAMDTMLEQNAFMPSEGRKAVQNWMRACKKELGRFKVYVEDGFTDMEKNIGKSTKSETKSSAATAKG